MKPRSDTRSLKNDWHFVDWLQGQGIGADLEYLQEGDKPVRAIRVVLYGYFLTADVPKQFEGQALDDFLGMIADTGEIDAKRRLTFSQENSHGNMPWALTLTDVDGERVRYRVRLEFWDTTGLMGQKGYAGLAGNLNIALPYKDLLKGTDDIKRMNATYFERPTDFDNYALGDLLTSDMIVAYDGMLRRLYADIGLEYAYTAVRCLKMTIGATVAALYETRILDYHGVDRSVFGPRSKPARDHELEMRSTIGSSREYRIARKHNNVLGGDASDGDPGQGPGRAML